MATLARKPIRATSARSVQVRRAYVTLFRERPTPGMTPRMAIDAMAEFIGVDAVEALIATMPSDPNHWLDLPTRKLIAAYDRRTETDVELRRSQWEEIRRRAYYDADQWAKQRVFFSCCNAETCQCGF